MHNKDIIHRDLKPDNFLIKTLKGRIYLHINDFGLAKSSIPENDWLTSALGDKRGCINYFPPEVLKAEDEKP